MTQRLLKPLTLEVTSYYTRAPQWVESLLATIVTRWRLLIGHEVKSLATPLLKERETITVWDRATLSTLFQKRAQIEALLSEADTSHLSTLLKVDALLFPSKQAGTTVSPATRRITQLLESDLDQNGFEAAQVLSQFAHFSSDHVSTLRTKKVCHLTQDDFSTLFDRAVKDGTGWEAMTPDQASDNAETLLCFLDQEKINLDELGTTFFTRIENGPCTEEFVRKLAEKVFEIKWSLAPQMLCAFYTSSLVSNEIKATAAKKVKLQEKTTLTQTEYRSLPGSIRHPFLSAIAYQYENAQALLLDTPHDDERKTYTSYLVTSPLLQMTPDDLTTLLTSGSLSEDVLQEKSHFLKLQGKSLLSHEQYHSIDERWRAPFGGSVEYKFTTIQEAVDYAYDDAEKVGYIGYLSALAKRSEVPLDVSSAKALLTRLHPLVKEETFTTLSLAVAEKTPLANLPPFLEMIHTTFPSCYTEALIRKASLKHGTLTEDQATSLATFLERLNTTEHKEAWAMTWKNLPTQLLSAISAVWYKKHGMTNDLYKMYQNIHTGGTPYLKPNIDDRTKYNFLFVSSNSLPATAKTFSDIFPLIAPGKSEEEKLGAILDLPPTRLSWATEFFEAFYQKLMERAKAHNDESGGKKEEYLGRALAKLPATQPGALFGIGTAQGPRCKMIQNYPIPKEAIPYVITGIKQTPKGGEGKLKQIEKLLEATEGLSTEKEWRKALEELKNSK